MQRILGQFFAVLTRCLLWLRYRIDVRGLDSLAPTKGQGGILFLPNHPGEIDPAIIMAILFGRYRPHPMAVEDFYYMPGLHALLALIGTIPMPNTDDGMGSYKRMRVKNALNHVVDLLEAGENVVIYPAGRLMREPRENLHAASAVHDILQRRPDTRIVLVRSRGLLGSSFCWLTRRERPDLAAALLAGLKWIVLNLVFFVPRRPVTVTFEDAPAAMPRGDDKQAMNRWLEAWYNQPGDEEPSFVPYLFWNSACRIDAVPPPAENASGPASTVDVPPEVRDKVVAQLRKMTNQPGLDVQPAMHLARDIGLDSLSVADLVAWLDETFFASDVDPAELVYVQDVMAAAVAGAAAGDDDTEAAAAKPPPSGWLAADGTAAPRPTMLPPDANLPVPVNFLRTCDRLLDHPAIADEMSGVLTYRRVKLAVVLLAEAFRQYPEPRLGVMLPASVGADLVIMAVLVAGKVPVMINWTLGDANLAHVLKTAELKTVISSGRFLDKVDNLNLDLLGPLLVTLEDLRRQRLGLTAKAVAWWRHRSRADAIAAHFGCDRMPPDEPCVILFTSGSEAAPKGVPLTHRNVLSDLAGPYEALHVDGKPHILYGFLPPFHSFGFTVTTVFPLVTGLQTAYHPNPTQSRRLASGIAMWKPTLTCGTPTFIAGIVKAAGKGQLASLRLVVTGAEKTPDELFQKAKELGFQILEGYGITETSPMLTMNWPGKPAAGVGQPKGDCQVRIVDIETRAPLGVGERGLILASGSNVFGGYLGRDSKDVFHEMEGRRWYITGDLGSLDADGNLTLSGRLKRFVKIGGEMVSLPAMEAILQAKYPDHDGAPQVALTFVEPPGGERPVLALFTTVADLNLEAANALLKDGGLGNLARLQQVLPIDAIPMLGTGKTDYRTLTAKLKESLGQK